MCLRVVDRAALQRPVCFLAGGPNEKGRYSVDVIVDDDECLGRMFMVSGAIVHLPLPPQHARMTREMQTLSFKPETCQHDLYSNSCRPGFEGCSICVLNQNG